MKWQFILIDYTTNPLGDTTLLPDEPIGWAEAAITIKRAVMQESEDFTHGVFFDFSFESLSFINEAFAIIQNAYNTNGINAKVDILVEYACSDTDSFEEFYTGSLDFDRIEFDEQDYCMVNVPVQTTSCSIQFKNRKNQKVDVESTTSFDGETLPNYEALGREIYLPGKGILFQNDLEEPSNFNSDTEPTPLFFVVGQQNNVFVQFGFDNLKLTEVNDTVPLSQMNFGTTFDATDFDSGGVIPLIDTKKISNLKCRSIDYEVEINLQGTAREFSNDGNRLINFWNIILRKVAKDGTVTFTILQTLFTGSIGQGNTASSIINVNWTGNITLDEDDKLYLYIFTQLTFTTGPSSGAQTRITYDFTSGSFKMKGLSMCESTPSKVFLVNETLSRITESITNDCLRVYSDYFGRPDAQPYPSGAIGCGAETVFTSGLMIRNATRADGSEPKLFLSFKDIIESLNAIHNIGYGLEPDPNRPGKEWLRIEPVNYWYSNTLLLQLDDVKEIKRSIDLKRIVTLINIGYSKWEAEQYNGLDEFLTKRTFRTEDSNVTNTFNKLSNFIASGYAIEVTRRYKSSDTKDWIYDNDTFIICVKTEVTRSVTFLGPSAIQIEGAFINFQVGDQITITGTSSNDGTYDITVVNDYVFPGFPPESTNIGVAQTVTFEVAPSATITGNPALILVEQGAGSAANILDPDSVYNFRISPIRNLMRWFKSIAPAWSRQYAAILKGLIFTNGDGNYLAQGKLNTNTACSPEDGDVLNESQSINKNTFANAVDAVPIWEPENIEFEYPLSQEQFKLIKANPKGLIRATQRGKIYEGWIEQLDYKPNEGIANFKLIKKYIP